MKRFIQESTRDDMLRQLLDIRSELDHQRQVLIQHLTTLDATLLGLVTVFHDKFQTVLFPPSLTVTGVILLFLSLTLGIYYLCMAYRVNETIYHSIVRAFAKGSSLDSGSEKNPRGTLSAARLCPIFLCLGTLFLLIGVFLP